LNPGNSGIHPNVRASVTTDLDREGRTEIKKEESENLEGKKSDP